MPDPFVHLHVASGYSLQYGASHPHVLVERAAEQEMDTLALTDRDGTYGAVRFAKACLQRRDPPDPRRRPRHRAVGTAGRRSTGRPLGRPTGRRAQAAGTPARGGGASATPGCRGSRSWPAAGRAGRRCAGWSRRPTCAGERGDPVATLDLVAEHVAGRRRAGAARARLRAGPGGDAAPRRPRPGRCCAAGARWSTATDLLVEVVSHRLPAAGPGSSPARRPDGRAGPRGRARAWCSPTRSATPTGSTPPPSTSSTPPAGWSPLDAAPRRPAATPRASSSPASRWPRSPRRSAATPGSATARRRAGCSPRTRAVADRCALDPRADLGLGEVHFPEFELSGWLPSARPPATRARPATAPADAAAAGRAARRPSAGATAARPAQRIWKRLDDELRDHPQARLRVVLPHRRRRHRPDPRAWACAARPAGRARAAWSTTCSASPGSTRSATAC